MKLPIDYSMRTKILQSQSQYANYIMNRQAVQLGEKQQYSISFPFKEASAIQTLQIGEVNTTPEQVANYLAMVANQFPGDVPEAPVLISTTSGNEHIEITFIQGAEGGSPITNYEYSLDGGITYRAFSPAQTASPVLITGLINNTTYSVRLRARNAGGTSSPSNTLTDTPTGTNTFTTFTTVGTTTWTAPTYTTSVTYLVVGGGGGSGGAFDSGGGGGGGAGLVLTGTISVVGGTTYTVVVGDGGTAGVSIRSPVSETRGGTGGNSQFASVTAAGGDGGYGSRQYKDATGANRYKGGAQASDPTSGGGGSGGGGGGRGGGGGGNGSAGIDGNAGVNPGQGGSGISVTINGITATYGAGGNGSPGGVVTAAAAGTANTGNGARAASVGGSSQANGAAGGTGYVAIQYNQ